MKAQRLILSAAVAAASTMLVTGATGAQASGPTFACDPGFYQVIAGQLNEFDPETGVYNSIGPDHANYNAMAHRLADGYMYAIRSDRLLRVDAAGAVTDLGAVPIVPGAYTGEFGDDGLLHVSRGGGDWYKIDVDTLAATAVPELSQKKNVADVANISGVFYGISSNGNLWRYDPINLTVTNVGAVSGLPSSNKAYGAAWSTAGNNLYIGRNSGEIYQITGYSGSSPIATRVLTAPSTNSNDGSACMYAPPPASVPDVDGAEPEVPPSTPEGQAASDDYEQNHYDPEYSLPDAGLGTGASCAATLDEDRLARESVSPITVSTPTVLYDNGFDSNATGMAIVDGSWTVENGTYRQINTCGFDYSAMLTTHVVESFDLEVTFHSSTGINQGGVVFHQSSLDTRSGATVIDLADDGQTIRWGFYDELGYYQNVGWDLIPAPAVGETVTFKIEARGNQYTLIHNTNVVTTQTVAHSGGMVGLVTSISDVSFEAMKLTAMPAS